MRLNLDITQDRGIYRAEISDSEALGGSRGAWATSVNAETAVQSALESFNIREHLAEDEAAPTVRPADFVIGHTVAFTPEDVEALLTRYLDASASYPLTIDYNDAEGNATTRAILPSRIEERGWDGQKVLVAVDVQKDEPRHFRLDRIEQIQG